MAYFLLFSELCYRNKTHGMIIAANFFGVTGLLDLSHFTKNEVFH